jgi:hypothetical protein
MIPESKIQELWVAARAAAPSERVPYAFEKRVMSALQDSGARGPVASAVAPLWRAALVSVAVAMMAAGLDFAVQDPVGEVDAEDVLELAVLPIDEVESEL